MTEDPPNPTVLVIDDNPTNLQVASDHLSKYAYKVLTALDGERGFRRARLIRPDLILLDIAMPAIDGFETCRRLKAHPATRSIPVLFMTASVSTEDKVRAFELGGVDYVPKPFEPQELLARVRTHLRLATQQRELSEQATTLSQRVLSEVAAHRQERGSLANSLELHRRLSALVTLQSEQIDRLTRAWLPDARPHDLGLAGHLAQAHTERLRLIAGELALALETQPEGPARPHLKRAQALLEPVVGADVDRSALIDRPDDVENPLRRLSAREREVFQLLVAGRANKEIGYQLGIKATTVSTYRLRILEKLGVDDVVSLVRLSIQFPAEP